MCVRVQKNMYILCVLYDPKMVMQWDCSRNVIMGRPKSLPWTGSHILTQKYVALAK